MARSIPMLAASRTVRRRHVERPSIWPAANAFTVTNSIRKQKRQFQTA